MRFKWSLVFVVAGMALSACAEVDNADESESDSAAEIKINPRTAWELDAGTNEGGNAAVSVSHTDASGVIVQDGSCHNTACPFPFLDGTVVHLSASAEDTSNCQIFQKWTGACAGQGRASCNLTIHSNLTTQAIYIAKRGCGGG